MKKVKKTKKPASSIVTQATSRPSLNVDFTDRCLALIRQRSKTERAELGRAIDNARDSFGTPRAHQGIGLRKLRGNYFECRAGLSLRLVLESVPGGLRFLFVGDHDH